MRGHPGGDGHTLRLLELAELPEGAFVLDMGAGAGESLALFRERGFKAEGIDLAPRSELVERGNFLHTEYPDETFDAVVSQCAFFVSGDQPGAIREAYRLLRKGGKLLLSDVFFSDPQDMLRSAGFDVIWSEDMSGLWKEYYLEALWRDDALCYEIPKGNSSYHVLIGRKDGNHGSY
jgi:ubiquinone/menaquinone biosynthesis C-methylase UbiE